jgi:hypothetical protein
VNFGSHGINRIAFAGGKRAGLANGGYAENLGVIGHWGNGCHTVMRQERPHQASGPTLGHEGIRIQQNHMVAKGQRKFQARVDGLDKALIFFVFN